MKKSTILLLVVVYVLSFFLISLLGHSLRVYNEPEILPESIEAIDPDNRTERDINYEDPDHPGVVLYNYFFAFHNYENGMPMRLRAIVSPENCSYPNVTFEKDDQDKSFTILTHKDDETIEEGFCSIVLTNPMDEFDVVSAPFFIWSTNPGTKIKVSVCVTFACGF